MCDVCNGESGGHDVGVAAIPGAPMSVMWCNECLANNAIPRHIVEWWLFQDFDEEYAAANDSIATIMRKDPPGGWPLADWTKAFTIWAGVDRKYVNVVEMLPELWKEEFKKHDSADVS